MFFLIKWMIIKFYEVNYNYYFYIEKIRERFKEVELVYKI